ncbi:MAG: S9 family peptidase, partial [Microvirga sp.]|nr:S9 family peptidase [Microvirga sp.]
MFHDTSLLDPAIRDYLEAENAYQEQVLGPTGGLRKTLIAEMRGRIKEDDSSVPAADGPYAYGISYQTGAEYPRFIRTPREGGTEEILLDVPHEAGTRSYFSLGAATHSPDHARMAWSFDDKGSEFYTIAIRDLESGQDDAVRIDETAGGATWSAGSDGFFYTRMNANHRPDKLFYHRLGKPVEGDRLVFEEADAGFFMNAGETQSRAFVTIDLHDHETSEVWLIPSDAPDTAPRLVAPRETGVEYSVEEAGGLLYILTNADGAKDFKIVTVAAASPGREGWQDLVPHEAGRLILSHFVL